MIHGMPFENRKRHPWLIHPMVQFACPIKTRFENVNSVMVVMDSVIIVRLKYNAPRKREIIKYEWEIVVVNPKTRFGYPFQNFATKPCGARDGWRWKIFELPMVENCLMSRNVFYARVTRFVNVWNAMVKDRLKIIDPSMIDIDWYGNCDESPKKNDNHICVCVNYKLLSIYEFRSETRPHPHNLFLSLQTAFDLVVERHWESERENNFQAKWQQPKNWKFIAAIANRSESCTRYYCNSKNSIY